MLATNDMYDTFETNIKEILFIMQEKNDFKSQRVVLINKIITINEAAEFCNVSRATIWRWIKSGKIKAAKTAGGHHRIDHDEFITFMDDHKMHFQHRDKAVKKILVVDDDPRIRKYFKRLLNSSEIVLELAKDGFEAGLKTANFKPDLIILDLFMPKMDGFSVCKQIKDSKETSSIKIIAITGLDTDFNKKRILLAGADAYLAKPVGPDMIFKKINDLLNLNLLKVG